MWSGGKDAGEVNEAALTSVVRRLWTDEQGQDLVEYGMLMALIVVVAAGTVQILGLNLAESWGRVTSGFPKVGG